MSNLELEDLVYGYPDSEDENFQNLISSKKEFIDIRGAVSEPVPEKGKLFNHQKALQRYMRQYDRMFVMWDTGTGKSCGVAGVTEYYKNDPVSPYKQAFFLAKGEILLKEFQQQVVCKCTDGEYEVESNKRGKTLRGRKKIITKVFDKYYNLETYERFAKILVDKTDDQLVLEYSGSIFIVDEAHNLRIDPKEPKKSKKSKKIKYEEDLAVRDEDRQTQKLIYRQLYRLFRLVKRCKIMLLSATPMINRADELGPLINLLLPANVEPIPDNVDWTEVDIDQLEPKLRSRVSYVRALDTGAKIVYQGEKMNLSYDVGGKKVDSKVIVYPVEMSEFQANIYKQAEENPASFAKGGDRAGAFSVLKRQVSNMVFPDGSIANTGFKEYVKPKTAKVLKKVNGEDKMVTSVVPGEYSVEKDLKEAFSNEEEFVELSSKFAEIVKICQEAEGNCWIFSNFVEGAGAIALSIAFEQNGFSRFKESTSIFENKSEGSTSICTSDSLSGNKNIRANFKKELRYGLLTSDVSGTPRATSMLEAQNSPENKHGEYLKVMIGSPITREGLNLSNVTTIILVDPSWNNASNYQAISRAIRSTSHVDLLKEAKEEGKKVQINIYRMVSVVDEETSIDERLYGIAETKNLEIERIFTILKQCSFDCQINYNRNVRTKSEAYTCFGLLLDPNFDPTDPKNIDYSSYDVLYSDDEIERIKKEIQRILQTISSFDMALLYATLNMFRPKLIEMAVERMISNREPVIDRYGFESYLRNDKEYLYLQRTFPLETEGDSFNLATYTETLIGIKKISLNDYVQQLADSSKTDLVVKFKDIVPKSKEFYRVLEGLSQPDKVRLLERSLRIRVVEKKESEFINAVISYFKPSILKIHEPIKQIKEIEEELKKPRLGRPKEKGLPDVPVSPKMLIGAGKSKEEFIYIHTLTTQKKKTVSYGESATYRKGKGKLRILKPTEGEWRDLNAAEDIIYHAIIEDEIRKQFKPFEEKYQVYGTILPDGVFRIIDNRGIDLSRITDLRHARTGQNCSKQEVGDLVDIAWYLKTEGEPGFEPFGKVKIGKSLKDMRALLVKKNMEKVEEMSDEYVKFAYMLYTAEREKICPLLQEYFENNKMLYVSTFYSQ